MGQGSGCSFAGARLRVSQGSGRVSAGLHSHQMPNWGMILLQVFSGYWQNSFPCSHKSHGSWCLQGQQKSLVFLILCFYLLIISYTSLFFSAVCKQFGPFPSVNDHPRYVSHFLHITKWLPWFQLSFTVFIISSGRRQTVSSCLFLRSIKPRQSALCTFHPHVPP